METLTEWPNAGRVAWLSGGIVAYNNPGPDVEVCAGSNGHSVYNFKLGSYGSFFEILKRHGFPIIGATFVVHNDEIEGIRPSEFRAAGTGPGWPLWNVRQRWREIFFAAGEQGNMPLLDASSRVASGLEYSQLRLYDLVSAYAVQSAAHLKKNEAGEYQRFKDLFSREVYKAIHALFWELAVLRDVLAEFAAMFCESRKGIRTLSGLLRDLRRVPSNDLIAAELLTISDEQAGGWLSKFTSYRNFFTHIAPMELATGSAFTVQDMRRVNKDIPVPQIYYPLPGDIETLTTRRSSGGFYPSMVALQEASMRRPNRDEDPDALEYLHGSLDCFVELAGKLSARSPVAPRPIHLTAADLVGDIVWVPGDLK